MQVKTDLVQAPLGGEVIGANALDSKRVGLLVSEKSLERQLQLGSVAGNGS